RQVLDNLAMFSVNPSALPSFSVPDTGASNVTDTGGLTGNAPTNSLLSKFYALNVSRQNYDQWTLVPIRDPRRLALMRCAYQRAFGYISQDCPDCCALDREFRGVPECEYDCYGPCTIASGWVCCSDNWADVPKCCHRL